MTELTDHRLLVANRAEAAVRVLRAAADLGIPTVAVTAADEPDAPHLRLADGVVRMEAPGPGAYLDVDSLVATAVAQGCTLLHPGWGFASEDPALSRACAAEGVTFVGPGPAVLERFGDKLEARALATEQGVPVLRGTPGPADEDEVRALMSELGPERAVMLKAVGGGGGRGMRIVADAGALPAAYAACRAEATAAFGRDAIYAEELLPEARHGEVQCVADGEGRVVALGDRDCSVQRLRQKLVEMAPALHLSSRLRDALARDAVRLVSAAGLVGLATVEFLVDASRESHHFLEVNPRLQVEHTVTEEVTGVDLVTSQLRLALGASLEELGLGQPIVPRGVAVQARIATETLSADGALRPAVGTVRSATMPGGPGVRIDTHVTAGLVVSSRYDTLLAKVVAHDLGGDVRAALRRLERALGEVRVVGVETNIGLLRAVLLREEIGGGRVSTSFVEEHLSELLAGAPPSPSADGARDDCAPELPQPAPPGMQVVPSPMAGTVVELLVEEGQAVGEHTPVVLLEAMKMRHEVAAGFAGTVRGLLRGPGDEVTVGTPLLHVAPGAVAGEFDVSLEDADLDEIRPELAELLDRRRTLSDEARPEAVAKRHGGGRRTARENLADLCDPDSFVEYGGFAIAAQRARRSTEELIARTPADGLIGGLARVNGDLFADDRAEAVVLSYDYMVLAGTQGVLGHRKKDRLFELTERLRRPVVFFTEGGGGRPGDTDQAMVAGLDTVAFALWARLSGVVPRIGVASGRCFAGNAAILGACDVVIATADANIGMGGPAMIEGGGLGTVDPDDVGPLPVQTRNGVVDVAVSDDAEAVAVAKQTLSYFQGAVADWQCADQRLLRQRVPADRLRAYDVRAVVDTLADTASVLELRPSFAPGMVTSLARIEGVAVGVVANNPLHLAGAITSDGADKAARFLQLCEAFDLPVVFLCDTPGIMVGPEAEATGLVRHAARLFLAGAHLTVPFVTVVLRKGYGLGAQGMAGGSFRAPLATVSWPTGEFGGMGLEGAVKLAMRKELGAIEDPQERQQAYEGAVAWAYEQGKALSMASYFEIDDVIDPAETRQVVTRVLRSAGPAPPRTGRKAGYVDAW